MILYSFPVCASESAAVDMEEIETLAEMNGVEANKLEEAIIEAEGEDRFSPFSNLQSSKEPTGTERNESGKKRKLKNGVDKKARKENQSSTAYTAKPGTQTASGKIPQVGMCAMHTYVTKKTGYSDAKTIKLGTRIFLYQPVNIMGQNYSTLYVEDRGKGENRTDYWIDVCFGLRSTTTDNAAKQYGIKTVSYYYQY